ncbi:MAG: hypothetical protein AB8H79_17800 [Myxococcota bacterium]
MIFLWLAIATAADTPEWEVSITPAARLQARDRLPWEPTYPTPAHRSGPVIVDGILDEEMWASKPGRPLLQLRTSRVPPRSSVVVLGTPNGLAVAVRDVPEGEGWSTTLTLDPTGTRRSWLTVRLDPANPTSAVWTRCQPDAIVLESPVVIEWPARSTPCAPLINPHSKAVKGDAGWELLFDQRDLALPLRTSAHLGWFVLGPQGAGGTWNRQYQAASKPPSGLPLDFGDTSRATLALNTEDASATLTITSPPLPYNRVWTWASMQSGLPVETGVATQVAHEASATALVRRIPYEGTVAVWADGPSPIPSGAIAYLPLAVHQAVLLTPVHEGHVELGLHLLDPYTDCVIQASDSSGLVLAETQMTLPAGKNTLHLEIPSEWPDRVRLQVGHLLDPETTVLRAGFAHRMSAQ